MDHTRDDAATRPARSDAPGGRNPIRVRERDGRLELRFPYVEADVDAIRAIPGRRWISDRKVWTVPDHGRTRAALGRAFGDRLVMATDTGHSTDATDANSDRGTAHATVTPDVTEAPGAPGAPDDVIAELRRICRTREYSPKTERAYVGWARRFLRWSVVRVERLDRLDSTHAAAYLEHLATRQGLAPKSRNQAASALAFMFREVMGRDELAHVPRARGPERVPAVLSHGEVIRVLRELSGKHHTIGVLLYSAGLRLEECLRLRVKDVDFELRQIIVRDGKGRKDRYVPLAQRAVDLVRAQIAAVARVHADDRAAGHGWAPLPGALHRKDPVAGYRIGWQYLFPATTITTDAKTDRTGRHPLHATAVQRAVKSAAARAGITKRATCHTFRHSFATETLRGGCDIRTLQYVMGHKDIRTTMIYLHVVEQSGLYIRSPLDRPDEHDDLAGLPHPTAGAPATPAAPAPTIPPSRLSRHWELVAEAQEAQRRPHGSGEGRGAERKPERGSAEGRGRRPGGRRGSDEETEGSPHPSASHTDPSHRGRRD